VKRATTLGIVVWALAACVTAGTTGAKPRKGVDHAKGPTAKQEKAGHVLEQQIPFQRWAPLPGRKVGLLVAVNSPWGTLISWGRGMPAVPAQKPYSRVYWFLADGDSPRALYFESHGEGLNFLEHWTVPLPDGKSTFYDAAMFGPDMKNRFGLGKDAHLVELEVNSGQGAPGNYIHFVATDVRLIDGRGDASLHADLVLGQASTEFRRFVDGQRGAIDSAMKDVAKLAGKPFGPETSGAQEGVFPTWSGDDQHLRVLFVRHEERSSSHTEMRNVGGECNKYRELPLGADPVDDKARGPNAPMQMPGRTLHACPPPHQEPAVVTKGYGVEIAASYEFDASGKLIAVTEYLPAALPYRAPDGPGVPKPIQ
jgi:hypothetical protein